MPLLAAKSRAKACRVIMHMRAYLRRYNRAGANNASMAPIDITIRQQAGGGKHHRHAAIARRRPRHGLHDDDD